MMRASPGSRRGAQLTSHPGVADVTAPVGDFLHAVLFVLWPHPQSNRETEVFPFKNRLVYVGSKSNDGSN